MLRGPLVGFVDDDGGIRAEVGVAGSTSPKLGQEHAVGQELDLGGAAGGVLEADFNADCGPQLFRRALRRCERRRARAARAARLGVADHASFRARAHLQHHLRKLGGLAGAGFRRRERRSDGRTDRLDDLVAAGEDGESGGAWAWRGAPERSWARRVGTGRARHSGDHVVVFY